jgi:hypothetical protein
VQNSGLVQNPVYHVTLLSNLLSSILLLSLVGRGLIVGGYYIGVVG